MSDDAAAAARAQHRRALYILIALSVLSHASLVGCRIAVTLGGIDLGASPFSLGLLMAFFGLLPMVLSVPAGRMVDRIGTRRPMFWGLGILVGSMMVPLLSWEVGSLFLVSTATGFGYMCVNVGIQKLGGEIGGAEARTLNFGLLSVGFSISAFLGPLIAGVLIDLVGYRITFGVLLLLPVAAIVWLRRIRFDERLILPGANGRAEGNAQSVLDLLRDPKMRQLYVSVGLISAAWDVHQFVVPIYGKSIGLSASVIGLLLASYSAATFVIRMAVPLISRRVPEWPLIIGTHIVGFVVYSLYPFTASLPLMMALSFTLGLGLGISQPIVLALLHRLAPPERAGEAVGLRMVLVNGTQTFLPGVFGAVGGAFGVATLFWGMALLLGGSIFYIGRGVVRPSA